MTENTIDELIKINNELVQSDKIDSITYHSILTRLEYLKSISEWKLDTAMTIMGSLRIDIIASENIEKGVTKMLINIGDLHRIMNEQYNKKIIK